MSRHPADRLTLSAADEAALVALCAYACQHGNVSSDAKFLARSLLYRAGEIGLVEDDRRARALGPVYAMSDAIKRLARAAEALRGKAQHEGERT